MSWHSTYAACGVPYAEQNTGPDEVEQGHAECTDGIDNDRDGLVDCEEGYCKSSCEENCYCEDCYRIITVPEVSSINVKLWEGDFLPPDDLLAECDFTLGDSTLKQRVLTCRASNDGIATGALVELTLDPHVAP